MSAGRTRLGGLGLSVVLGLMTLAPATTHATFESISVLDNFFEPRNSEYFVVPGGGPNATWDWDGPGDDTTVRNHDVVHTRGLFSSGAPTKTRPPYALSASAGKFPYYCSVHRITEGMKGKLTILPVISDLSEDAAHVQWASDTTRTGNRFDVRYRVDGRKWKTWLSDTRKFEKAFGKNDRPVAVDFAAHDYQVAARSEKGKPQKKKRSGFSPPVDLEP